MIQYNERGVAGLGDRWGAGRPTGLGDGQLAVVKAAILQAATRLVRLGVRPRGLRDMRHDEAWIFGATCPERDTGVALVLPEVTVPTMQALINELAGQLPVDRHAVVVMDRAGWHIAARLVWPDTITPLRPRRRVTPEAGRRRSS